MGYRSKEVGGRYIGDVVRDYANNADTMVREWNLGHERWSHEHWDSMLAGMEDTEAQARVQLIADNPLNNKLGISLMSLGEDSVGFPIVAIRKDPVAFGPDMEYGIGYRWHLGGWGMWPTPYYTFARCQPERNGSEYSQIWGHYDLTFEEALKDFRERGS